MSDPNQPPVEPRRKQTFLDELRARVLATLDAQYPDADLDGGIGKALIGQFRQRRKSLLAHARAQIASKTAEKIARPLLSTSRTANSSAARSGWLQGSRTVAGASLTRSVRAAT